MDSSTLLCRTPTGDSEVAVPASGLSITQRRILTLLDTPARLGELPLGPSIDAERLCREVHRLAQAGLIASAAVVADPAGAANAATLGRLGAPRLLRGVRVLVLTLAVVALAWAGWRFSAASSSIDPRTPARAAAKATVPSVAAPAATPEPPVIATRILRGDPSDRYRDAPKDAQNSTAAKATPSATHAGAAAMSARARCAHRSTKLPSVRARCP